MSRLLIIDDEPNVRYSLEKGLANGSLEVFTAGTGRDGIEMAREVQPDVAILDVRLPDQSGLSVFEQIQAIEPRLPVIIITAFAGSDTAIAAMKQGAFEYLLKPVDLQQLRQVVSRALDLARLRNVPAVFEPTPEQEADLNVDCIVGNCPAMQDVYKTVGRVAAQNVPVLILGESGTGKELVARAIYQHSRRSERPFLAINCAALSETLLESELFGHERGAFTGADRRRIGKFEQCHGGTLFLDEVGDMTPATQARVLRVLQDGRFERVGGNETVSTDVRIIAATNRDLDAMLADGRFRADLLYRLNTFTIRLPPLRERVADIPALVDWFIRVSVRDLNRDHPAVDEEVMRILEAHSWPGNVRELQSAIRYALVHAVGNVLTPCCLPESIRNEPETAAESGTLARPPRRDHALPDVARCVKRLLASGQNEIYRQVLQQVDRTVMDTVLKHVGGNQVQASELLGISRTTLRARLEQNHQEAAPDP